MPCANDETAFKRFLPTFCAKTTGSGGAFDPASTRAVLCAGLAAVAVELKAATCASTEATGSQLMPSVACAEEVAKALLNAAELAEGMKVPRRRKIADGLAFERLESASARFGDGYS